MTGKSKRFRVALSFPGEHRAFVQIVAQTLAQSIGRAKVFYDKFYEAELAQPDLDTYLQNLYNQQSDLVVVFLCAEYEKKEWCGLEWRAIRELIKNKRGGAIMPVRFDKTEIPGLFSLDGYVSVDGRSPREIAELIIQRLSLNNTSKPSACLTQSPGPTSTNTNSVSNSGRWILLSDQFFEAESVKNHADGKITIRLLTDSAEKDAAIKALRPTRLNQSKATSFAHCNDAFAVSIKRFESESAGEEMLYTIDLEPQDSAFGGGVFGEVTMQGRSPDDIAKMRAGRILLNDPPPPPANSNRVYSAPSEQTMLESFIAGAFFTGSNPAWLLKECPLIRLYSRFKSDPQLFLNAARLQAVFLLKATGTIEHVLKLSVGPLNSGTVNVSFRGLRRQAFANRDATVIELSGICRLE